MSNSKQNQPGVPQELIDKWWQQGIDNFLDPESYVEGRKATFLEIGNPTTNTAGGKPDLYKTIGDAFDAGMIRAQHLADWIPDKETYLSSLLSHPAQPEPQEGGKDVAIRDAYDAGMKSKAQTYLEINTPEKQQDANFRESQRRLKYFEDYATD
ncbi:MAG TPA: hypothetical protein VK618_09800 [Flavitalea sp.]|nr:hypothetical protein [Flavitalea sp.]